MQIASFWLFRSWEKQGIKLVKTGFENPDFRLWTAGAAGPLQRRGARARSRAAGPAQRCGALRARALRGAPVRDRGAPPLFWHFSPNL